MKLRTQILLGFLFILVLTLFLTAIYTYYLERMGKAANGVLTDNYRSIKNSEQMIISLVKIDQVAIRLVAAQGYDDSLLLSIIKKENTLFEKYVQNAKENSKEEGEDEIINSIGDRWIAYRQSQDKLLDLGLSNNNIILNELQKNSELLRDACLALIDLNHTAIGKKDRVVQNLYKEAKIYVYIIAFLVLALAAFVIVSIPQRIVKPMQEITFKMNEIAQGKYGDRLPVQSQNEFGEMAQAFNLMSEKLKDYEQSNLTELQAQKSRIEYIINHLSDGLIILDENKVIVRVNPAAENILGLEDWDLIGKRIEDLGQKYSVLNSIVQSLEGVGPTKKRESAEGGRNFLEVKVAEDKSEYFTKEVQYLYNKQNSADRKSIGYIVTLKNITSFKKSDEAKSNFLAVVSHELKTPLSAMNMSLMLLQDPRMGELSEEQSQLTASMKREVQRLIKMVSELLDLSKVESGNMELDKQRVLPELIVEYALAPIDIVLREKEVHLHRTIAHLMPKLMADPDKVSWVLSNFLTNAIRYTRTGGDIWLEVLQDDEHLEFAVQDEGPGIPDAFKSKVFNKFFQLNNFEKGKKNKGGLGLGLAISKEVVEAHGGEIGVTSDEGKGCRFYFRLPIEIDA